jgi:hypothetical protein
MFEELLKAIGLTPVTRNFLVEYHDKDMMSFHKALQTIDMGLASDKEIVKGIIEEMKEQGNEVYGVIEFFGEFTMNELMKVVEDPKTSNYRYRALDIDYEKAFI